MKELALYLVKQLSDQPDKVEVQESDQNGTLLLKVSVAEEDKGRVIGKQGKVIKAWVGYSSGRLEAELKEVLAR